MVSGRPRSFTVKLSAEEHEVLNSYARSRSLPHALARRAKIVVMVKLTAPTRPKLGRCSGRGN